MLTIRTSVVRSVLLCLHKQVRTSHIKNYHYYGIEGCSWTYCRRISLAKFYQKPFAKVKRCQSTLSAAMSPGIIQSPLADVAIPENAALAQHIMSEFLKHGSKIAFVSRDFFFCYSLCKYTYLQILTHLHVTMLRSLFQYLDECIYRT